MSTTQKKSTVSIPTDTENINETNLVETNNTEKKKTCFVIMPIAEHPDYEKGHFNRVYEYLIKPACNAVGYEAVRADDSKASHMIMFDILKKIVECDMAICDLSTKNANVFYELGLRQAFDKKTILITDGKEKAPFDISGFRYVQYSPTLRVDECSHDIIKISEMLNETIIAPDNDVNSIVKLLEIEPANIKKTTLKPEESVIFEMIINMNERLDNIANSFNKNKSTHQNSSIKSIINRQYSIPVSLNIALEHPDIDATAYLYELNGVILGELKELTKNKIVFTRFDGSENTVMNTDEMKKSIKIFRDGNIETN